MPRRVLTKVDIDQMLQTGTTEVRLGAGDIVTALAREYALDRGVRFVPYSSKAESSHPSPQPVTDPLATEIRSAVISALGEEPAGLDEIISRALR